jgi:hypothetical protein
MKRWDEEAKKGGSTMRHKTKGGVNLVKEEILAPDLRISDERY